MFESISKTQIANYTAFVMFVVKTFDLNITGSEIEVIITGGVGVIAIIIAWIERYKKGDITKLGMRKVL